MATEPRQSTLDALSPLTAPAFRAEQRFDHRWQKLALGFALLVLLSLFLEFFDLDKTLAGHFYSAESGWFLKKRPFWDALHHYGTLPGLLFSLAGLVTWLASFYRPGLRAWRKPCMVIVLTAVLGAGLLVNAVLKQYWGRPRPSQTIEYGGQWEYRPIFHPGPPGQGASFPCGHATMGFVFLAAAGCYRHSRRLAGAGVICGIAAGVLLSAGRIVQGAHFLSDALWSFGLIGIMVMALIYYLPEPAPAGVATAANRNRRHLITALVLLAIVLMSAGFLTRRPFFKSRQYPLQLATVETIAIRMKERPEQVKVQYSDAPEGLLRIDAHGFGWIKAKYRHILQQSRSGHSLQLELQLAEKGYFAELDHDLILTLPSARKNFTRILVNGRIVSTRSAHAESSAALQ
ncbi:phosphatase PAP2 family protein [Pelobacter seleniigenes]|uniref:phosphatase PAP2 family protein n=1 Tax=Pelobacter seleniigenes TaxID=407188 RepID=UPI0004A6EF26|nr:phosphatase PAP2 family protein [Pelobacter seleniigenes]